MERRGSMQEFRREYRLGSIGDEELLNNPYEVFSSWFTTAVEKHPFEPNACALATCGADGLPRCRMVLLKKYDPSGFVFFSNYNSQKGRDLKENPNARHTLPLLPRS